MPEPMMIPVGVEVQFSVGTVKVVCAEEVADLIRGYLLLARLLDDGEAGVVRARARERRITSMHSLVLLSELEL